MFTDTRSTDQLRYLYSDNSVKRNSNERRYALKVTHDVIITNISVVCGLMLWLIDCDAVNHL